jgi:glyoxylate/hydroxypyruvate reductase
VQYILLRVLHHHRHVDEYAAQQQQTVWHPIAPTKIRETGIALLGAGRIGGWAARLFAEFGFRTAAWSRSPKQIPHVDCYHGPGGLKSALAESDYVVCTLPLTKETQSVLDADLFAIMKRGAYFINVGRGAYLNEEALLSAIDGGQLSGACLDVFASEPLAASSPLWTHPRIAVTPHVVSYWVDSGIDQVADVCRHIQSKSEIANVVDLARGY